MWVAVQPTRPVKRRGARPLVGRCDRVPLFYSERLAVIIHARLALNMPALAAHSQRIAVELCGRRRPALLSLYERCKLDPHGLVIRSGHTGVQSSNHCQC